MWFLPRQLNEGKAEREKDGNLFNEIYCYNEALMTSLSLRRLARIEEGAVVGGGGGDKKYWK